jgi:CDP-paratose 2-epimerase
VCGDGFQVRDILHVQDLVDAMMAAREARKATRGQVFNLGGGMSRAISVIELLKECERRTGLPLHLDYTEVRPGDQPLYISNTSKLEAYTGWAPHRSIKDILDSIEGFWRRRHKSIGKPPIGNGRRMPIAADLTREVA